jgi:hypothetical protein
MPMPTPTTEMRIADRIRILRHAGVLLIFAAVLVAPAVALVLPCPIHSY